MVNAVLLPLGSSVSIFVNRTLDTKLPVLLR